MDGGRRKSTASVGNTSPKGSTFKVTLSIRREPGGSPVYCKMDGRGRFKQSKTVKLAADSIYRVDVSFKPPRFLRSLAIGGQDTLAKERTRDGTASAYSGHYSTKGMPPSAKGQREDLHILMRVTEAGDVCTCLQVKVYRSDDQQHSEWGNRLHCIELDCSSTRGERAVTVNRETYRKFNWIECKKFLSNQSLILCFKAPATEMCHSREGK